MNAMYDDNRVQLLGYLLNDPDITDDKATFHIRTTRMDVDGYLGRLFEDLLVYYEDTALRPVISSLKQHDFVLVLGEWDIFGQPVVLSCPHCGCEGDVIHGTLDAIYPRFIKKVNSSRGLDTESPFDDERRLVRDSMLNDLYMEYSNQFMIGCDVMTLPEIRSSGKKEWCEYLVKIHPRYQFGVRSPEDAYRCVKTWGEQKSWDMDHLREGTELSIYGFMRTDYTQKEIVCPHCQDTYVYQARVASIYPYRVNYVKDYTKTTEQEGGVTDA